MLTYPHEIQEAIVLEQNRFVWEAPSAPRYERGPLWYVLMTAGALLLVAYAVWTANFLFAFLILLIAIILVLAGNEAPKTALAQIGEHGIVWDGRLYLYADIDQFAIVFHPPYAKLMYVELKSAIHPRLRIPLEDQDPNAIREHLVQFLPQDTDLRYEHFSDMVARLLRI